MTGYFFFAMVTFYWVVVATDRALFFFSAYRREEVRRAEMARELTAAQLEALRSQLQPHFLFNTFHGIAALIRTGRTQAALDTLLQLGSLLRFTLDAGRRGLIPLGEELAFLEDFMAIEQRRFSDRLVFAMDVADEARQVMVPAMVLQPLVENAVKHGVEEDPDAGKVSLVSRLEDGRLHMDLFNDGPRLKQGFSEGVGLSNTRRRLAHRYGDDYAFEIANAPESGVCVHLSFPVHVEDEAAS
jgi:LytS/YehU family sensor histidine kinase